MRNIFIGDLLPYQVLTLFRRDFHAPKNEQSFVTALSREQITTMLEDIQMRELESKLDSIIKGTYAATEAVRCHGSSRVAVSSVPADERLQEVSRERELSPEERAVFLGKKITDSLIGFRDAVQEVKLQQDEQEVRPLCVLHSSSRCCVVQVGVRVPFLPVPQYDKLKDSVGAAVLLLLEIIHETNDERTGTSTNPYLQKILGRCASSIVSVAYRTILVSMLGSSSVSDIQMLVLSSLVLCSRPVMNFYEDVSSRA